MHCGGAKYECPLLMLGMLKETNATSFVAEISFLATEWKISGSSQSSAFNSHSNHFEERTKLHSGLQGNKKSDKRDRNDKLWNIMQ
jgi:hypothetical protein